MSEMNLKEIYIDQFYALVENEMKAVLGGHVDLENESTMSYLALGKAGIGKTEGIRAVAEKLGVACREVRLAHCCLEDMSGIPEIKDGRTVYSIPDFLPTEERDGKNGFLVLDEITSATKDLRTVSLNLLEASHKLNSYTLPKGWVVVALGNGIEDGGNFMGLETTILTRCISCRVVHSVPVWKKWAFNHGVNPVILAFIDFKPDLLHSMNVDEEAQACASPRSWVSLSRLLNRQETMGSLNEAMLEITAATAVGEEVGRLFSSFYRISKESDLIKTEDILDGKANAVENYEQIQQVEKIHIIAQSLSVGIKDELKKGRISPFEYQPGSLSRVINAINWLIDLGSVNLDASITLFRSISEEVDLFSEIFDVDEFLDNCPRFMQFLEDNAQALAY